MPLTSNQQKRRRNEMRKLLGQDGVGAHVANVRPTDKFPTPNPFGDPRNIDTSQPLRATIAARTQYIAWLMLAKNAAWRSSQGLADETAVDAWLPPAYFADFDPVQVWVGYGDPDPDDGTQTYENPWAPSDELAAFMDAHPAFDKWEAWREFALSKLRAGALAWAPGDPQP